MAEREQRKRGVFREFGETLVGGVAIALLTATPDSATPKSYDVSRESAKNVPSVIFTAPTFEGIGRMPEIGPEIEYKTLRGTFERIDQRPAATYLIIREDTDVNHPERDDADRLINIIPVLKDGEFTPTS